MQKLIYKVIDQKHFAFLEGREILDSVVVANKII